MHMLRAMGHLPSPEHIKTITRNMRDNHGKGGLKFEHFKEEILDYLTMSTSDDAIDALQARIESFFAHFDRRGDGCITRDEFVYGMTQMVRVGLSKEETVALLATLDKVCHSMP